MQRFYFDHNATTPVGSEALETMVSCLGQVYGNASSIHHFGQGAKQKLETARRQVASLEPHQCFHIAPPPFTEGPPFPDRSWKTVPVSEIYEMTLDFQKQMEQP